MFPHPAHSLPALGRMLRCAQHDNAGNVSTPSPFITGPWADASLPLSMTMRGMFPHPAHSSPVLGRMLRCAQHDNEGNVSAPSQIVTGSWA
ncbi:MAG: hypothetical protein LLG42_03315, partial [Chloroflexi bacterium]|nr:hypothetical protein [Chloroflexota bacterium]